MLGDGDRFDAEDDDLVGALADLLGQLDDLEDVDFVQGQMSHLFDAVNVVGGESFDRAGFGVHERAVNEDDLFAFGDGVQQVHPAAAAVIVFDRLGGQLARCGELGQFLNENNTDTFVSHQRVAESDYDCWFWFFKCHGRRL